MATVIPAPTFAGTGFAGIQSSQQKMPLRGAQEIAAFRLQQAKQSDSFVSMYSLF